MKTHPLLLNEERCRRLGLWILLAVAALLYLPGTSVIPLMDRDEPRFGQATVEMMERSTWTVPYFNGEYRFDKPPLTYWWMRLHYELLGMNELAARMHGLVAAWLTALVIAGLARRVAGTHRAGVIGGLLWLTTLQVLIHGRLCVADMPMVLCVTLACRALMELLMLEDAQARSPRWFWVLWLSLGLGFLAKGPVAWIVPALGLVLWRFVFWRKAVAWRRLRVLPGMLVMLAPVVAWGVPALIETQGLFWQVGMGRHVVQRGVEVLNGRKFIPGYYLLTTWVSLFPWSFFVLPAWQLMKSSWRPETAFLAACFVAPQIVFFFYATQLPHYVMPGYPAFVVLLATAWAKEGTEEGRAFPGLSVYGTYALGGLALAAVVIAFTIPIEHVALRSLARSAACLLAVILLGGGAAAAYAWTRRGSWALLLPGMVLVVLGTALLPFADSLRTTSVTIQAAHTVKALPAETRCLGCGYDEPSLVYYTGRRWQMGGDLATARQHLEQPGPCAVILLRREWTLDHWLKTLTGSRTPGTPSKDFSADVDALCGSFPNTEVQSVAGFNAARSSWTEVVLLARRR